MNLYEQLGVDKKSDLDDIKKAYKNKVKKMHPDVGGNEEDFKNVSLAYSILSDEEKRKKYDSGVNPNNINKLNENEQVLGLIVIVFDSILEQNIDFSINNIFNMIRNIIENNKNGFETEKIINKDKIEKYNNVLKRIKVNDKSELFIELINDKIKVCNNIISNLELNIKISNSALKFIESCDYEIDKKVSMTTFRYCTTCSA